MTWSPPTTWLSPSLLAVAALVIAAGLVAAPVLGRRPARQRLARMLDTTTAATTTGGGPAGHPAGPPADPSAGPSAGPLAGPAAGTRTPSAAGPAAGMRTPSAAGPAAGARTPSPASKVRLVAGLAGIAVALLAGGWFGLLAGVAVATVLARLLPRLEPAAHRRQRMAEAAALPLAADLLAVALRSGAPVDRATVAVAQSLPGPLGQRLARVGRALQLGATPEQAWSELEAVAGADRWIRAAVRSAEHGGALAGALSRLADDLRADRAVAVDAAARRAAVLIVLPLGLCFLPAFVLAGLVPVIIAVLGDVL